MLQLRPRRRRGITLTEILIAIMIMGVGLVSLATLFPIGLLKLRDATRYTRSALLLQSAACDLEARQLFYSQSFTNAEALNYVFRLPPWYYSATMANSQSPHFAYPPSYNPLLNDTAYYSDDPYDTNNPGATSISGGPSLPFAYDPLWRYQTGVYLDSLNQSTFEARFGSGIGFLRPDSSGGFTSVASAHGLQRITNFNRPYVTNGNVETPVQPSALFVPNIFVSQEDMVWQDPKVNTYTINGQSSSNYGAAVTGPSPLIPDLSPPAGVTNQNANLATGGAPSLDWRYSWMFTGQQTNTGSTWFYDGNIVIWENRPFGVQAPPNVPFPPGAPFQVYQVEGETVVEAIFGYSNHVAVAPGFSAGYGTAADRTVLLRWSEQLTDPVVRVGDWIADVTYERQQWVVYNPNTQTGRFENVIAQGTPKVGYPNPSNNYEWDNMPPQRCYWYQVQKVTPAAIDLAIGSPGFRSMIVYVNQSLVSRTALTQGANGPQPVFLNAALIAPNVINVIPQTITVR